MFEIFKNINKWSTPQKVLYLLLLLIIIIAIFTPKSSNNYLTAGFGMRANLGNLKGNFNIEAMKNKNKNKITIDCGYKDDKLVIPNEFIKESCRNGQINCTVIEPNEREKYTLFADKYYIQEDCIKKKNKEDMEKHIEKKYINN